MKRLCLFLLIFAVTVTLFSGVSYGSETCPAAAYPTLGDLVFFGDSTTYGLFRYNAHNDGSFGQNYYTLQDSQIWVPKEGTFYLGNILSASVVVNGSSLTLPNALEKYRPKFLVLTVGINGLASWNKETFCKYYEKLIFVIKESSPNTVILLQSVYPIADQALEKLPLFSNDKIDAINCHIKDLADRHSLIYLNTASVLKDENGKLKEAYHNGDGLHLSTKGFNAMLKYVEIALSKEYLTV